MKKIYFFAASMALPFIADAQSAIDGFRFSQPDMKGTARYMGMAGAFGALGGDLSSISTNPAGIGVYRRNEIGITLDVDVQSASAQSQGVSNTQNQTKALLNNVGGVATWNLANSVMPNINVGFTYNRGASFNSHYVGTIPSLSNSLTNYIAGASNNEGVTVADVETLFDRDGYVTFDPYNPNDGGFQAPWLSILGYNSYFISPTGDDDQPDWVGQWQQGTTSGGGAFDVQTSGGVNEYNIAIGGNVSNKVFWGVDFGIVDLSYSMTAAWGENLRDARLPVENGFANSSAQWKLTNSYNANGTGYNVKVGVIYRPIQELRLGVSFASPTWYSINESYIATTDFRYGANIPDVLDNYAVTNGGQWGLNSYNFRTPWKLTASAAGVIGRNLIISADFEWQRFDKMRFYDGGSNNYYGYGGGGFDDWGWDPYYAPSQKASPLINTDQWYQTNADIEEVYKSTTAIRIGAEYRITPRFSIRAGYANVSSPVRKEAKDGSMLIYTSGTMPNYRMDNSTNYITCGLGYNFDHFYIDGAFVHKNLSSEYHAYTSDPANPQIPSPTSKLSLNNNQIVVTAGVRF